MKMEGLEKALLRSKPYGMLSNHTIARLATLKAGLTSDADVLEIGCGGGFNTRRFAQDFPGWRLTSIDYDPEMVATATERLADLSDRVEVSVGDATSLGFPDASFDVAISVLVWHHVGEWEKATSEAMRVLRPGGKLVVVDLLQGFFIWPLGKLFPPVKTYRSKELAAYAGSIAKNIDTVTIANAVTRLIATR